jgi:hypothetical protein
MFIVIFEIVQKNKNVINIYYTKNVKKKTEYFVNLGLKSD